MKQRLDLSSHADLAATAVPLPFVDLKAQYARLKPEIDARISRVLTHGKFILGPEVAELEAALSVYSGVAHVVACASGTDALLMALMAEGVSAGDAVFLPSFTFTATAEVVLRVGATPVFVDVDPATYLLDCEGWEDRIRAVEAGGALRARAVIAVDIFGLPADYERFASIAERHGLFLLADGAQSFGAALGDKRVGSLAPVTATSFFPSKPLGCYGDGGALFTDDAALADAYRSTRGHGTGQAKYDIVRIGLNSRLDTLQAAVLLAKLPGFDDEIAARERLAQRYDEALRGRVTLPPRVEGRTSAWAQYTIQVPERDSVASALKAQGIPTAIHYPLPMHLQPAYEAYGDGPGSLPVSERLSEHVLSLPMHPDMDEASAERICSALLRALT